MVLNSNKHPAGLYLGAGCALAATLVWSGNFVVGRGLADVLPPASIAFFRWVTAFALLLPFAAASIAREWRHFWHHRRYYLILTIISISYFNTAIYYAAQGSPALNLALLATSSPLFTILLGRMVFGEPIYKERALGIAVLMLGIVYLLSQGNLTNLLGLAFTRYDLLMLSASVSFSIYTLMLRKKPAGSGQLSFLALSFGVGALFLVPFYLYDLKMHGFIPPWTSPLGWQILYLGAGPSLFSFWAWMTAVKLIGSARASLIYYTIPLFCGVEAILFLGEAVTQTHWISAGLIIGGLILASKDPRAKSLRQSSTPG